MRYLFVTTLLSCLILGSLQAQNKKTLTLGAGLGYTTGLNKMMYTVEGQYFIKENFALRGGLDYAEDRLTVRDGEIAYTYLTSHLMLNLEAVKTIELLSLLKLYGFAGVQILRAASQVHGTQSESNIYPGLTAGAGVELTPLPLLKPFIQLRGAFIPGTFNYSNLHHLALTLGIRFQIQEGD
ncbi:MAG: outer membrane beta-barrel protein [Bacteroidota bacterium]